MVVHITVLSPDGTYTHPYQSDTPVARIRQDAFSKIHPANISVNDTFLLFGGVRITDESLPVSQFAQGEHKETATFTLSWHNPAGAVDG
jgi:hypothetical protein